MLSTVKRFTTVHRGNLILIWARPLIRPLNQGPAFDVFRFAYGIFFEDKYRYTLSPCLKKSLVAAYLCVEMVDDVIFVMRLLG